MLPTISEEEQHPTKEENGASSSSTAAAAMIHPNVFISTHPVLAHKISLLRSSSSSPSTFRCVLREITFHLGYEATKTLATKSVQLTVPLGHEHMECSGLALAEKIALIPILRSGLGMSDAMLELLPNSGVHHIGMYRGKGLVPIQYYNRLPKQCVYDVAYILDPVISTSNTVSSVVGILTQWGVQKIHVISVLASKSGLDSLVSKYPHIQITLGAVDDELTKDGLIYPGVGDTGDRLFGTFFDEEEDQEALFHPSKRRKMSEADLASLHK